MRFRQMIINVDHPQDGALRQIGNPVLAGGAARSRPPRPAPAIGADTGAVLRNLGLSETEVAKLHDANGVCPVSTLHRR